MFAQLWQEFQQLSIYVSRSHRVLTTTVWQLGVYTHAMQAVTNTEREELWQDFLRDREKREREAKRAKRRERAAAFRDLLLSTPAIKVSIPASHTSDIHGCISSPGYSHASRTLMLHLVKLGPATAFGLFQAALSIHRANRRLQVDTPWRKAVTKLEGDPAYEALDKIDRLEVFQDYIKCATVTLVS